MMKKGRNYILFVILFLAGILACSEIRPRGDFDIPSHNGNGETNPSEGAPLPAIFPHAEGWANPVSHGLRAIQSGIEVCIKCHQIRSDQPKEIPACNSCHASFPHVENWVDLHGTDYINKGRNVCATQCHGTNLEGGLSNVSCKRCHTMYPHEENWESPGQHGSAALGEGKNYCKICHGNDFSGGLSNVACASSTCHNSTFPHDPDWRNQDKHGKYVVQNGKATCSTGCHGTDLKGGLSGVSCNRCHEIYPHTDNWESEHGGVVGQIGKSVCADCHGSDFKKFLNEKNCFSCHEDYPHPDSATWIPYRGGHGERVQVTHQKSTESCKKCHGDNFCFSCHGSYPHNTIAAAGTLWKEFSQHGQYGLDHRWGECTLCHGENYQGGARQNPSCQNSACHATFPHQPGWGLPQALHGPYVVANSSRGCATERCHGVNLVPNPNVTKGPDCNSCHQSYPHPDRLIWATSHGPTARANITQCKICHGDNLDWAPAGFRSCKNCHASYLQHPSAAMGITGWATFNGHGKFVKEPPYNGNPSECQTCHGVNYDGGISNVSCKNQGCHPSYPHTDSNWGTFNGHASYVFNTLNNDKTACKLCHGNNLTGGNSGQTCYDSRCHTSYPHDGNWRQPSEHGVQAYGNGKFNCNSANCHRPDFSGNPPRVPGCKDQRCHPDFPHTNANWIARGRASGHAGTFIQRIKNRSVDTCNECHGANYSKIMNGISCKTCHPGGVTHLPNWSQGQEHGARANTNCYGCHGNPVTLSATQTQQDLENQSTCYRCHSAYPHINYNHQSPTTNIVLNWKPLGHDFYLQRSPLFTDALGRRPSSSSSSDPILFPALSNTCGGSRGFCHFNGLRSRRPATPPTTDLCGRYCHR